MRDLGKSDDHNSNLDGRRFRRNQTITRARTSFDDSDRVGRKQLHQIKKRRRSFAKWLSLALGVVLLIGVILYQSTLDVSVQVYGSVDKSTDTYTKLYAQSIKQYLAQHPAEHLRFLINTQGLTSHLQSNGYNEVKQVVGVSYHSLGKTTIKMRLREPVARWTINKKTMFVDSEGNIFEHNYYKTPNVNIIDRSQINVDDKLKITSLRFLQSVGQTMGLLDDYGYKVKKIIIPANSTRQVWYDVKSVGVIKMATDRPVGEQTEDAHRAIRHLSKKSKKINYIDVRVSGRAYYK